MFLKQMSVLTGVVLFCASSFALDSNELASKEEVLLHLGGLSVYVNGNWIQARDASGALRPAAMRQIENLAKDPANRLGLGRFLKLTEAFQATEKETSQRLHDALAKEEVQLVSITNQFYFSDSKTIGIEANVVSKFELKLPLSCAAQNRAPLLRVTQLAEKYLGEDFSSISQPRLTLTPDGSSVLTHFSFLRQLMYVRSGAWRVVDYFNYPTLERSSILVKDALSRACATHAHSSPSNSKH